METTRAVATTGCKAVNRSGKPCGCAAEQSGSGYCWFHNPAKIAERKAVRSAGGRARHNRSLTTADGGPVRLRTIDDVLTGLETVAGDLQGLENSISRAGALTRCFQAAGQLIQAAELETRLQRLEAAIGGDS